MRIAEFSVRHYQFTVVVFLMLIALGIGSWRTIPRAEDPTFPIPVFTVVAVYPGATPNDLEQLVVDPIEERVGGLDQVKDITTFMEDGLAIVWVEFEASADAARKEDEMQREMNALRQVLPRDLYSLSLEKSGAAEVNFVQIALVSEVAPYHLMEAEGERLKERIENLPGVHRVTVSGSPKREVRVALDLHRLSELRIPVSQVLGAIGSEDANIPGGNVEIGGRKLSVRTSGNYADLEEVRNTVIGGGPGQLLHLRDVADVDWGYEDQTHIARFDGRRAIWVSATMKTDVNIMHVRDRVYAQLDGFESTLAPSIKLERGFDQSKNVAQRLGRLGEDFMIAIALVLVTLLPLGIRASLVVMISIPLSLAIGVAALNYTGFTINQLSIVGFVIALGLLVDDSIVVVENISRLLRQGYSRRDAAIAATKQIAVAVVGCTATLIFAFLPLLFLPGLPGRYIRVLPVTVVYTVLASLFVSLTIIPWLSSLILHREENPEGNRVLRWFNRGISRTYAPLLHRALERPYHTIGIAAALFIGSLLLVPVVGFSLFPKAGTPQFHVDIETPAGSNIGETDRAARFAEKVIGAHPSVKHIFTNVGRWNPQVYYNVYPRGERSNIGQLFVLLHEYDNRGTPLMLDSLRAQLAAYPGAEIEVKEFENGPPVEAPIAIRVLGDNLDTLRTLAARIEQVLSQTPGTQYVDNPLRVRRSDLQVAIDRSRAGLLGVPTIELDRAVRLGLAGLPAGRLRDIDGEEYGITVRLPNDGSPTPRTLQQIYLASLTGAQVPLGQVATLEFTASPSMIQHFDRQRSVTVTSHVQSGFNTDRVTTDVLKRLEGIERPDGYEFMAAGELEARQDSFGGIGGAITIAIFSILAILILEFRTFRSTLIVASVIPLGVVGGILALLLTGYTLSFAAMVGFVALIGIEIKTSILLVDFTNQLRREGVDIDDAIQKAGEVRFLPIVLTTLTAIGGLLPLAVQGSSLFSPLAWVIIGGLVSSTLLARLVTPVMYKVLAPAVY